MRNKNKSIGRVRQNFIGFFQRQWKNTKFNIEKHKDFAQPDVFIKFWYGPRGNSTMVGKITQVYDGGVQCSTNYGPFYHASWDQISRIYLPKTAGRINQTKVKAAGSFSVVPILDGAINKIKNNFKLEERIKIADRRVDLNTKFYRIVKFSKGHKYVQLNIENASVKHIQVSGSDIRNSKLKVNKGKVNTSLVINKIKNIMEN